MGVSGIYHRRSRILDLDIDNFGLLVKGVQWLVGYN